MKKIVVTDDHPLVINGLQSLFEGLPDYEWMGGFTSGKETLEKIPLLQPDLLFLDVALPDADGISLCKEIKAALPHIKIIALTSFADVAIVRNMIAKGADGYLLKSADQDLILQASQSVLSGKQFLDPDVQQTLIASSLHQHQQTGFLPRLTRREQEVLHLIADEMTTPEIADKLCINHKTVESHRMNLLQKLGVKNMAGLIRVAVEKGLIK